MQGIEELMPHAGSLQNREYTLRGMAGNIRRRDPSSGYCYKNGGKPPYGYRSAEVDTGQRDRKGRRVIKQLWEIDPSAAEVVRRILRWRGEGRSYREIRDALNAEGIPSPKGDKWAVTTIVTMCREDCVLQYAGYGMWNRHYMKGPKPRGVKFKPREEWVIKPNAHPAIISEEEAHQVIAQSRRLAERKRWRRSTGRPRAGTPSSSAGSWHRSSASSSSTRSAGPSRRRSGLTREGNCRRWPSWPAWRREGNVAPTW